MSETTQEQQAQQEQQEKKARGRRTKASDAGDIDVIDQEAPPEGLAVGPDSQPSELVDGDVFATDPTPGAVTEFTEEVDGEGELPMNIREGSWVVLLEVDEDQEEMGARPGMVAVVKQAPYYYAEADDMSPIRHAVPQLDQPLVVQTRDEKSLVLSVAWEQVALATTQAPAGAIPL